MSILKCNGKIFVLSGSPLTWDAISIPTVTSNLTYTGDIQSPTITGYDENTMTVGGKTNGTNAGTYEITFTPKSGYQWDDGTNETKHISWSIAKAPRNASVITSSPIVINTNSTEAIVKIDGIYTTPVDPVVSNSQVATATFIDFMQGLANVKVIKVGPGTCTVTVNAAETTNYLATSCSFDVECYATVEIPSQSGALTYTGSAQSPTWNNYNSTSLTVGGTTSSTNAGTYTATFTPIAPYATWTDGSSNTKNVNWTIERATIATVPSQGNTLIYTGNAQSPTWSSYDSAKLIIGGTTSGTKAGDYRATFTPTVDYKWSDGTTTAKSVLWSIGKKTMYTIEVPEQIIIDTTSSSASYTLDFIQEYPVNITATSKDPSIATVSIAGNVVTITKISDGFTKVSINSIESENYKYSPYSTYNNTNITMVGCDNGNLVDYTLIRAPTLAPNACGSYLPSRTGQGYNNMDYFGTSFNNDYFISNGTIYMGIRCRGARDRRYVGPHGIVYDYYYQLYYFPCPHGIRGNPIKVWHHNPSTDSAWENAAYKNIRGFPSTVDFFTNFSYSYYAP